MSEQLDLFAGGMVETPAQRDTSLEAADQIRALTGTLRLRVLHAIVRAGERGLTDEEGIEATGIVASTYRPRRVELHAGWQALDGGYIEDSGRRRRTRSGRSAAIWVATDKGRRLT